MRVQLFQLFVTVLGLLLGWSYNYINFSIFLTLVTVSIALVIYLFNKLFVIVSWY